MFTLSQPALPAAAPAAQESSAPAPSECVSHSGSVEVEMDGSGQDNTTLPTDQTDQIKKDAKYGLKRLFQWPTFVLKMFLRFSLGNTDTQNNGDGNPSKPSVSSSGAAESAENRCQIAKGSVKHVMNELDHPPKPSGSEEKLISNLASKIDGLTLSTAFSGIETPSTALSMLGAAMCHEMNMPVENSCHCRHKYAVEWNAKARAEILKHPNAPEHLFGDVEDFWLESMRGKVKSLKERNLIESVLIPLIKSASVVGPRAWCYKHNDFCKDGFYETIGRILNLFVFVLIYSNF